MRRPKTDLEMIKRKAGLVGEMNGMLMWCGPAVVLVATDGFKKRHSQHKVQILDGLALYFTVEREL